MLICILIFLKVLVIPFISLLFIGFAVYLIIKTKFNYIFNIKAKTIKLKIPIISEDNTIKRASIIQSEKLEKLISSEAFLRRFAYKNTTIKTSEYFFDDSDMKSEYYLVIVYDKISNVPLLSARYYFDKSVIIKYLQGDNNSESTQKDWGETMNLYNFKEGEIFLVDRLSGNISSSVYRKNRKYIYLLFYSEILTRNKNCKIILMARRVKYEKLLTKYLHLGFNIVGTKIHNGKEHWILSGDLKKSYSQIKLSIVSNIILMSKYLLFKQSIK